MGKLWLLDPVHMIDSSDFAIARYQVSGISDSSFGINGKIRLSLDDTNNE
jgi:hypothetical protein